MVRFITLFLFSVSVHFSLNAKYHSEMSIYITCPTDKWLTCEDELWDLSIYGEPMISSSHPYTVEGPIEVWNLNDCNVGHITRDWIITDYWGKKHYCHQKLKVKSSSKDPIIDWPKDYTTDECAGSTEPDDLPVGFGYPVVTKQGDCSSIAMGWEDKIIKLDTPFCKKVIRTWTVYDWCVYEPRMNPDEGIWEYIQILKVISGDGPEITCPADVTASATNDCDGGFVQIPLPEVVAGCSQSITITNNSPYAQTNGADASGNYPIGETWIEFTAKDGCGNSANCKMKVIVRDNEKPTPICKHGLTTTLSWMSDGYYIDLPAEIYNHKSYDNCTPADKLKFTATPSHFTCNELGKNKVWFTVEDESGNKNTCETYIIIQDNMGMCPDSIKPLTISGNIMLASDDPVDNIKIALNRNYEQALTTDESGKYLFEDLVRGEDYKIRPYKTDGILQGVSSIDLFILLKHVLDIEKIRDPYQLIAADVDKSGKISIMDVFALRNALLGITKEFPNNRSWRFVDANFEFDANVNPLEQEIPETYSIERFKTPMDELNFYGIKIGDINQSLKASIAPRSATDLILNKDVQIEDQTEVQLTLSWNNQPLDAMLFTLRYNPMIMQFRDVANAGSNSDVQVYESKPGILNVSYLRNPTKTLASSSMALVFDGIEPLEYNSVVKNLSLAEGELENSGYWANEEMRIVIADSDVQTHTLTDVLVYPNPVSNELNIALKAMHETDVQINFYSTTGDLLYSDQVVVREGLNHLRLNTSQIVSDYQGVLLYKIINDNQVHSGQLIKLE